MTEVTTERDDQRGCRHSCRHFLSEYPKSDDSKNTFFPQRYNQLLSLSSLSPEIRLTVRSNVEQFRTLWSGLGRTEPLTIISERVDDLPLLLAQLERMGVQPLLDEYFQAHGHWVGHSPGWVTVRWLTHSLSQADHRLNHVAPGVDSDCTPYAAVGATSPPAGRQ